MLKVFSGTKHDEYPHLISLLATYEQSGVYYLIFPYAESNLTQFWQSRKPEPSFDLQTVMWVAEQCAGIARGLKDVHQHKVSHSKLTVDPEIRFGRHGDLKPENILWFKDDHGGTLKISDFGSGEWSTNNSRSNKRNSAVDSSMSYRPPDGEQIEQSSDIWNLGCIYLEFITWLLGGWVLVEEFVGQRVSIDPGWSFMLTDAFFEIRDNHSTKDLPARVKPTVTNVSKADSVYR